MRLTQTMVYQRCSRDIDNLTDLINEAETEEEKEKYRKLRAAAYRDMDAAADLLADYAEDDRERDE